MAWFAPAALRSGVIGAPPLFLSERLVGFLALALPRPGCHPGAHEVGSRVNCPGAHLCQGGHLAWAAHQGGLKMAPAFRFFHYLSKRKFQNLLFFLPFLEISEGSASKVRTRERYEVCSKVRRARCRSPVCPGCAPRLHLGRGGHLGWVCPGCAPKRGYWSAPSFFVRAFGGVSRIGSSQARLLGALPPWRARSWKLG